MKQVILYPKPLYCHISLAFGWKLPDLLVVQTDASGRNPQFGHIAPRVK